MGFLTSPCEPKTLDRFLSDEAARDLMADEYLTGLFREAQGDDYSFDWRVFFTADPEVLRYRRAVLEELEENPSLVEKLRDLSAILSQIRTIDELTDPEDISGTVRDFSILKTAYEALEQLRAALAEKTGAGVIRSEGLVHLYELCEEKLADTFPAAFPETWDDEASGLAQMGSMLFRFSLNDELRIDGVALSSVQKGRSTRSASVLPKDKAALLGAPRDLSAPRDMMTPLKELIHFQTANAGRQFVQTLRRITQDLEDLHSDLLFYLSALLYIRSMERLDVPLCYADIRPAEEKAFSVTGMVNPVLASLKGLKPVENEIAFAEGGELLILTGINQGGKTTFLRSVGLTQLLFQLGWPVPAETAALSPADRIVTVFSHEENTRLQHGKLGQELGTIRRGLDELSDLSLALFNEPVTGTSPMENLYLSREVLISLKMRGFRGIWVTHLYDLAAEAPEMNERLPGSRVSSIIAVVCHEDVSVSASYHIRRGAPEFTSYAKEMLNNSRSRS